MYRVPVAAAPAAVSRDEGTPPENDVKEGELASATEGVPVARGETDDEHVATLSASLFDAAVKAELKRYAKTGENADDYKPAPLSKEQLLKAAKEFVNRCTEAGEDSEGSPYVLVSRNCQDIPDRDFELDVLQSSGISKLWYALTKAKDLLIIKYASDPTHADGATELGSCVGNFAIQFGTEENPVFSYGGDGKKVLLSQTMIAPDALLNRNFPEQVPPEHLRAPFIAELEDEHRGPKELMEQLSTYLLQPVADYVLGIKVYKRSGPPAPAGAKRPFAAVALLWRRGPGGPLPQGSRATLVLARSFGTCELAHQSKNAFCTQRGNLQCVQPNQLDHPANHTAATDTITIPKAQLVNGAVDETGSQIHALQTDQDLTISLGRLRGIFNRKLPP